MCEAERSGIWNRIQSFLPRQRYDGLPANRPDNTGLTPIDTLQPLKFSFSLKLKTSQSSADPSQVHEDVTLLEDGTNQDPDSQQPKRDWIKGVYLWAKGSTLVLLLNLIFIAVVAGLARKYADHGFASGSVFYRGSCTLTKRWNIALHLIINGLSTCILAASNYCMQTLVAPTREEIDDSHARRRWLDIGGSSIRNLFAIGRYKLSLWLVLLITATPFHLLYNSMVFQSRAMAEYDMVIGPKDLSPDNVWSLATPSLEKCFASGYELSSSFPSPSAEMVLSSSSTVTGKLDWHSFASSIAQGHYHRLTTDKCTTFLNEADPVGVKGVVALASDLSVSDGGNKAFLRTPFSIDQPGSINGQSITDQHLFGGSFAEQSIVLSISGNAGPLYYTAGNYTESSCLDDGGSKTGCSDVDDILKWVVVDSTGNVDGVEAHIKHENIQDVNVEGDAAVCQSSNGGSSSSHLIEGCLVIEADDRCQLLYSPPICIVIMLTGLVKVVGMFLAARIGRSRSPPLLTTGDAVASFITKPDPTTERMCWLSSADVRKGRWKMLFDDSQSNTRANEKQIIFQRLAPRKFWMQAASVTRWVITLVLCLACIAVGSYLLERAITTSSGAAMFHPGPWLKPNLLHEWWKDGLATDSYAEIDLKGTELSMLGSIVVANSPQLIITLSYYGFNSVLTGMLAAAEYSAYGVNRKPLRVTWPVKGSKQRSTYWLSVPYEYAIPIMLIYLVLHWLVSQSIFYVLVIPFRASGQPDHQNKISELGYSPLPLFLAILVGGLMVCILVGLSFRRLKSHTPLAGNCSAAISAACHAPKDESLTSASLGHLRWGETVGVPNWAMDHFEGIEDQTRHCSFTSLDTTEPSLDKLYA